MRASFAVNQSELLQVARWLDIDNLQQGNECALFELASFIDELLKLRLLHELCQEAGEHGITDAAIVEKDVVDLRRSQILN